MYMYIMPPKVRYQHHSESAPADHLGAMLRVLVEESCKARYSIQ